jgi:hypothetical protein
MMKRVVLLWSILLVPSYAALKPETERSYQSYITQVAKTLETRRNFLLIDSVPGGRDRIKAGEVFVEERRPATEPPHGLIHHHEGAVFIRGVNMQQVLAVLQDYDNHKHLFKPEVIDSKTVKREGNDFHIRLRLLKKKILTVVLETEHLARYKQIDAGKWESASRSTKVSEVESAGSAKEKQLPPGDGYGFVWHLDSFWRFEEADGGVYVECTSVSLSRDVPFGMARLIRPIIEELPQESITTILRNTRQALKK